MTTREKRLPPVERSAPFWLALPLFTLTGGLVVLVLWQGNSLCEVALPLLVWSFGGLAVCISCARGRLVEHRYAAVARILGLRYRPCVRESDLTPFRSLSLFALSHPWECKASHLMEGLIDGQRVVLLHLRCVLHFRTTEDHPQSWWFEQSVILFPDVGYVPPFYFAAGESYTPRLLLTARPWSPAVGGAVVEVDLDDGSTASVRGNDEGVLRRLFSEEDVEAMRPLSLWTIESAVGRLMLYQGEYVFEPDEIGRYLHQAVRIASHLRSVGFHRPPRRSDGPAPPHIQPAPDG